MNTPAGVAGTHWYPAPAAATTVARLRDRFRSAHGRDPEGVWAAPGRVNVIGEHVDYTGGLCLPFALPHRTFVALAVRGDGILTLASAQARGRAWSGPLAQVGPGIVPGWAGYAAGVSWALTADGLPVSGFDAVIDSQVPIGAGLSSSAALECAVAVALDDVAGWGLAADDSSRARLAAACMRAENEVAAAPTGGLDQAAALRSRAGYALLIDCRDFTVRQVPFDLDSAGLRLLVIDTHVSHALSDGDYGDRRRACEHAARMLGIPDLRAVGMAGLDAALHRLAETVVDPEYARELQHRVRHVVTEIERVRTVVSLTEDGDLSGIGPVLDASHASLRDDFEVSCDELDLACASAREHGALGARMTGGGFGGSAIALVPTAAVDTVADVVDAAFRAAGYRPPSFLVASPSEPAGRA